MIDKLIQAVRDESWPEATRLLYSHWSDKCPKLYSGQDEEPWDNKVDEESINNELLAPLAAMYVLDDQKIQKGESVSLKPLTEKVGIIETLRKPGQLCGKMFKNGDPTYTCKECALDDTCVLCQECFKQSPHAKHKYKMHTSHGIGYCDCGDHQAWSKDYACKLHTSEPQPGDEDLNLCANLPVEVSARIYNVTGIVLKYAVTLICWQDDENLPSFLHEPPEKQDNYYKAMLFNDETHTYDAVINALEVAIGCTSQQAMHLATIVDREGRSVVLSQSHALCSSAKRTIQHRTRRDVNRRTEKSGPLEVKIMTASLVSHQALAVKLLNWLTQQAQQFPSVAKVIAEVIMKECSSLCKLNEPELDVQIPPPKPPRQMALSTPTAPNETPESLEFNIAINDRELDVVQAHLILRGLNQEDDVMMNAAIEQIENPPGVHLLGIRPRNHSTNQGKGPRIPKPERKYVHPANNKLDCGHFTTCSQFALFDRKLWKAARINFHQLLMATVFMDMEHKLNFGAFIIKNYEFLYQDFIDDDHDYNVSILALSVQVFTVASVAQHLLEHENAFAIICETLKLYCHQYLKYSESNERFLRYDFTNATMPAVLRRALTMFKDLQYLLFASTMQWTNKLKQSFIEGAEIYIEFLTNMQGMDAIRRQIDQHQMVESEWETAFNMYVSTQEITSMLIYWAKSDPYVHQRLAKLCIDRMIHICSCNVEFSNDAITKIDEFESPTIPFNVSRDYVSIHQPIWRLFAGLFTANPEILKYYCIDSKESPETIYLHNNLDILMENGWKDQNPIDKLHVWPLHAILEMPLRVLVLYAQCNAQLWRRNGFSLVNQIHNYTSPLCRTEMYDRDIHILQICAARMEPTEFLIRCLERFQLEKWAKSGFEDLPQNRSAVDGGGGGPATPSSTPEELSKIIVATSEELFHLLIIILGERYLPGIGKSTRSRAIEREIIHFLCTGEKTYSNIEKVILLEPNLKVVVRDEALNRVADFHKPASTTAGTFRLKEVFREEYNPFFWHYTKHQYSQAEQFQWREREKSPRHIQACPPPNPPEFEEFFEPITKIMGNPLFIRLLYHIVNRFAKRSRYSSEGLFHRGLYLIGMSLNEELAWYKRIPREHLNFLNQAEEIGIFNVLKELTGKPEAEGHKNLILWILDKYNEIKDLMTEKIATEEMPSSPDELQQQLKQQGDAAMASEDKTAKKKALAARKREQAMKRMQKMQKAFTDQNNLASVTSPSDSKDVMDVDEDIEYSVLAEDAGFPVCLGPNKSHVKLYTSRSVKCILCQDTEPLVFNGKSIVCCAYLQNSKLFTQKNKESDEFIDKTDVFTPSTMVDGYSISTCSHTMHYDCFKLFSDQLWSKDRNRARFQIIGQHIIDAESREYLCPLCKRLSNVALPLLPTNDKLHNVKKFSQTRPYPPENFEDWVTRLIDLTNLPLVNAEIGSSSKPSSSKSFKSHSRKRSHSERSLLELQKPFEEGVLDSAYSSSQPSVAPLSPINNANENPNTPGRNQRRGNSEPVGAIIPIMPDANELVMEAVMDAAANAVARGGSSSSSSGGDPLGILNKMKSLIKSGKCESFPMVWNVVKPFFSYVYKIGPDISTNHTKELSELTRIYKSTAFVLRSIAVTLKMENKPLFGALNTRQRDCILCLSRIAAIASFHLKPATCRNMISRAFTPLLVPLSECKPSKNNSTMVASVTTPDALSVPEHIKKFMNSPLRAIRGTPIPLPSASESPLTSPEQRSRDNSEFKRQSPSTPLTANDILLAHLHDEINILNVDMLSLAVQLSMTIGWSWVENEQILHACNRQFDEFKVPDGSVDELYSIYLTLLGYIFQNMASFTIQGTIITDSSEEDADVEMINIEDLATPNKLHSRLEKLLIKMSKVSTVYLSVDLNELEKHLTEAVVTFLQPIALLYNGITLIPPPDALKHTSYNEFESLCRYLGLPQKLEDLLEGSIVDKLFEQWTEHLQVFSNKLEIIPRQPLRPRSLVQLPFEFTDLITMCSTYKCPSLNGNELATNQPTMCLVCGQIMCSQSYCCQKTLGEEKLGACSYHMRECVGKSGMFLRIRDCQIIMLTSRKRGAYKVAPYVDQFGETDMGFRRGNPLFLHPEMYRRFQRLWLHQEIAEEVINQYEINHRNINFEWNHF